MAYDNSREPDMYHLHAVVNDETATVANRARARRTMELIQRQMRDDKLIRQRERLIKATKAGAVEESKKISEWLNEYMFRKYGISRSGSL